MRNLVVSIILLGLLGFLLFDIYNKKTHPINDKNVVQVVIPSTSSSSSYSISSQVSSISSVSSVSSYSTVSSSEESSSSSLSQTDAVALYNKFQSVANLPASSLSENGVTLQGLGTTLDPSTKIFVTNDRNFAYIVSNDGKIIKKILAPGEKQFTRFGINSNVLSLAQLINNNSTTQITINDYNINNGDLIQSRSFNVSESDVATITKD